MASNLGYTDKQNIGYWGNYLPLFARVTADGVYVVGKALNPADAGYNTVFTVSRGWLGNVVGDDIAALFIDKPNNGPESTEAGLFVPVDYTGLPMIARNDSTSCRFIIPQTDAVATPPPATPAPPTAAGNVSGYTDKQHIGWWGDMGIYVRVTAQGIYAVGRQGTDQPIKLSPGWLAAGAQTAANAAKFMEVPNGQPDSTPPAELIEVLPKGATSIPPLDSYVAGPTVVTPAVSVTPPAMPPTGATNPVVPVGAGLLPNQPVSPPVVTPPPGGKTLSGLTIGLIIGGVILAAVVVIGFIVKMKG